MSKCEDCKIKDNRIAAFEAELQATQKRAKHLETENGNLYAQVAQLISQTDSLTARLLSQK